MCNNSVRKRIFPALISAVLVFALIFCAGCKDDVPQTDEPDIPSTFEPGDTSEPSTPEVPSTSEPDTAVPSTSEPDTDDEDVDGPVNPPDGSGGDNNGGNNGGSGGNNGGNTGGGNNGGNTGGGNTGGGDSNPDTGRYSVTFNTDATNASYSTTTVKADTSEHAVMPETPTRSGYVFRGWYTAKNGGGERVTASTVLTSNITAYAYWTAKEDTIPDRNTIVFGTYDSFEQNQYALVDELGMDWVFFPWDHSDEAGSRTSLDLLYGTYGIKALILDSELDNLLASSSATKEQADALTDSYMNHPGYYGNWCVDEPGPQVISDLNRQTSLFHRWYPDTIYLVNLFPTYAAVFIGNNDEQTFNNYANYVNNYADGSGALVICQDTYPFNGAGLKTTISGTYLGGINVTAESARDHGVSHGLYMLSYSNIFETGMHVLSEAGIRYQAYSGLAFGVSKFNYWMVSGSGCLIVGTSKTEQFDYVKELASDFHSISSVYEDYNWKYTVGFRGNEPSDYIKNIASYKSTSAEAQWIRQIITDFDSDYDMAIGGFEETNGSGYALVISNQRNPYAVRRTAEVTFKLPGAQRVVAYLDGADGAGLTATTLRPDANGTYTLEIPSGDGVFLTVSYGD